MITSAVPAPAQTDPVAFHAISAQVSSAPLEKHATRVFWPWTIAATPPRSSPRPRSSGSFPSCSSAGGARPPDSVNRSPHRAQDFGRQSLLAMWPPEARAWSKPDLAKPDLAKSDLAKSGSARGPANIRPTSSRSVAWSSIDVSWQSALRNLHRSTSAKMRKSSRLAENLSRDIPG